MHPKTIIELATAGLILLCLFSAAIFAPNKFRRLAHLMAVIVTLGIVMCFLIRPLWIDIQLDKKTEQLNHYLTEKYPNESWEIHRRGSPQHRTYQLEVKFKNEPGWVYTYFIDDTKIYQLSWTVPDGQVPDGGKHYEPNR